MLAIFRGKDTAFAFAHEVDELCYIGQMTVFRFKLEQRVRSGNSGEPEQTVGLFETGDQFLRSLDAAQTHKIGGMCHVP